MRRPSPYRYGETGWVLRGRRKRKFFTPTERVAAIVLGVAFVVLAVLSILDVIA